jgi:hypothetical protein
MESDQVAVHVRERLGMEIQAMSLARARGAQTPTVWVVMTEHGHFWVVEGNGQVELFRAVAGGAAYASCGSAAEAARRFLELHPSARTLDSDNPRAVGDVGAHQANGFTYDCQACGTTVTRRRRLTRPGPALCKRCRHAERERSRYHDDPRYRARRLAYSAARYQQARQEQPAEAPVSEPVAVGASLGA